MINDFNENTKQIIMYTAQAMKRVNIVTNHINKFKKLEEYLYNELGIILNISNNKSKSLLNSKFIINVDFPQELINKYEIYNKAVIINILNNVEIIAKKFNGININYYTIHIPRKYKINGFDNQVLYESEIFKYNYKQARNCIIKDKVKIKKLIGINGEISEGEFFQKVL